MKEIKIYKSPIKAIKLILLCSTFVLVGLWLIIYTDSPRWVGWLNIIVFGLGLPVGLFQLCDRRPQIIMNAVGIFDRMAHPDFIKWEIIQDAYLANARGQKFICLVVDEKFEHSYKKSKLYQGAVKLTKKMGYQEVNLFLGQVQVDETGMLEFILAMSKAAEAQREELVKTFTHSPLTSKQAFNGA